MAERAKKPKKKPPERSIKQQASKVPTISVFTIRNLGAGLLFLITLYLISPPLRLPWITLNTGDYPKESVLAEIDFDVENIEATRLARDQAASLTPPVYVLDSETIQSSLAEARSQFDKIGQDVLNPVFTPEERVTLISKYLPTSISERTTNLLASLDAAELDALRSESLQTIGDLLNRGVLSDVPGSSKTISVYDKNSQEQRLLHIDEMLTLKRVPDALEELAAKKYPNSSSYRRALKELSQPFIRTTLTFDENETKTAQNKARSDTPEVRKDLKKNQEIVAAGHEVTPQVRLELQTQAKLLRKANRIQVYLGNAIILIIIFASFALYLMRFRPEMMKNNKGLLLVGILVFLTLATGRLILVLSIPDVWLYLVPVAAGSILLAILVDERMALVYSFFIALLYSAQGSYRVSLFLVGALGSLAGIFYMRTIRRRSDIFWPGIVVAVFNVIVILALNLIGQIREELMSAVIAGTLNGIITAIGIVPGSLTPLEGILGIATNIRLLELSDLNHPLLKRLAMQAPGTFHHSLMVGNMAEAAAEEIGANSLLARVGSYYHDVGKMNKPHYFSENQRGGKNKHDELTPNMSALVLIAHVKEGVELAREHRLNQPIIEFIQHHHGTSLMPFFYQKAMELDPTHTVNEENFRYPGPRPQTRETAICMLADSAEAASRSLSNPTHGRIKSLVEKIINNKFIDSQLDECDLTLKDMHQIADSFVRVLAGYLHSRVEYPEEQTAPEIKEKFEGSDTKVGSKAGNKTRINPKSN